MEPKATKRRELLAFLGAATVAAPLAVWPQRPEMPVIGFLNGASYHLSAHLVRAFHQGLAEMGFVEGRNVAFDYRSADGQYHRLPPLAEDLVRRKVNVIAATGTPTGLPAKAATTTIPIVFVTGSDPIQQGLVGSFSRPGGNLTGATTLAVELGKKRMELLKEVLPKASLIGVLINAKGPNLAQVSQDLREAARALGLPIHVVHASTERELDAAFEDLARMHVNGLVIGTDTFFNSQSAKLATLSLLHRVPAIYQYREFVAAGGLMSYAGSIEDAYRMAGVYTGRILKGEHPSNLPVQQAMKVELFVNLKTAKSLGIVVPQTVLVRAEEVLQ